MFGYEPDHEKRIKQTGVEEGAALAAASEAAAAGTTAYGAGLGAELAYGAPALSGTMGLSAATPWYSSLISGMNPVSAGLSVGSTLMQGAANQGVQDRQQKLADAMTAYKLSKSQQGQAATQKFLDTLQPDASANERAAAVNNLSSSLNDSVAATRKYESGGQIAGNTGADYADRLSSNNAALADRLKRAISQLSVIGAPAQQDIARATRYGRAASDVSDANTAANEVGAVYGNAINNQRPDPYLSLGAQIASGLGLASALNGKKALPPLVKEMVPGQFSLTNPAYG